MVVYFAFILTVLMGFCGLAIDVGRMELRTNQLQAAADAAALAAAGEVWHGTSNIQSTMQAAADADIATYETANNIPSTSPSTVVLGPNYGPYLGDHAAVQVTVNQSFPTIFLGLLTHARLSVPLTVRAVAQIPPCLIFFGNPNYTGTSAFWVTSSSVYTVQSGGCPLYTQTGTTIDYFSVYNGSQTRSAAPAGSSSYGSSTYTPIYSVPVIPDPLAYITAPTIGSCTNASPISDLNQAAGSTISFSPGTYCGKTTSTPTYTPGPANCGQSSSTTTPAIDVEGTYTAAVGGVGCPNQSATNGGNCKANPPTVNFAPGLYIIIGGINFTCVTVTGNGVTMYFTKSSSVGYGQMRMTGTTWNINAPISSSNNGIPGISVMGDRNWVGSTDDFLWMYSTWNGDGVVYLTGTGIFTFGTPVDCPNYLNIVAANMYNYFGAIHPGVNYASLPGGNPLQTAVTLVY